MPKSKLLPIRYRDNKNGILLDCYADTLIFELTGETSGKLLGIRFGGYPESVRGMSDAIFAGGSIEVTQATSSNLTLTGLSKQYTRQVSMGDVYSEAVLLAQDDSDLPIRVPDSKNGGQTKLEVPPRSCYLFVPQGDSDRLFEEIDRCVRVPLIPQFKAYLLEELTHNKALTRLCVISRTESFDAWRLSCTADDKNIIKVVEDGLKSGQIEIPGATSESAVAFDETNTVSQYLRAFGVAIADRIKSQFVPLFDPATEPVSKEILEVNANIASHTKYHLYDAQLAAAEGLKRKIDQHEPALIVAECGSGKTKIGATALYASHKAAGKAKTFNIILCPSHVSDKWVREIEETVPNSVASVIKGITQLNAFYRSFEQGDKSAFAVLSKEKARDGYMHYPAVQWSRIKRGFLCPTCHNLQMMCITDDGVKYEVPADSRFFQRETTLNHKCEHCGRVLWSPLTSSMQTDWVKIGGYGFVHRRFAHEHLNNPKAAAVQESILAVAREPTGFFGAVGAVRRFALSTYIKKKMRGKIDGCIVDELHQYNNNSGQGDAMAEIAATADKVIGMTATLINGYASGIFHLLYRLFPRAMQLDNKPHQSPDIFNQEYGVTETTYQVTATEYNANRRSSKRKIKERQLPGVSPLVYSRFLMENAVFLSLMDMGKDLPEYEEIPVELELREDIHEEYSRIERALRNLMSTDRKAAKKILSAYMNLLTVYPDQPYAHDTIVNPIDGVPIISPRDMATIDDLHPKDLKVLELARQKLAKGEKVLIYTSWVRIDTQDKLLHLLLQNGYRTKVLGANVAAQKREAWLEKELANGMQVLICNPSLVETGLDLNAFTTIIYYNIAYNLFTLRQSSRRSWRINQTAPRVEVYFLYYKGVMQARAMELMASKLAVAGLVEGNLSDEGLAAMSDCRDLTSQLAKELATGIKNSVEDIGAVFKRMAILHPDGPVEQTQLISEESVAFSSRVTLPEPESVPCNLDPTEIFVFAGSTRRRKKLAEPEPDENQLTLFDLPRSA